MRSAVSKPSAIALPSRYDLLFPLAQGGTASVHLGRLRGIAGFWRLVAVKVAHAHLNENPLCREMMVEEARLASKIHHPNVVPVIDIDQTDGRLFLVMDYIEGASLSDVLGSTSEPMPPAIAIRIALDAAAGLHAAHTLSDATGRSLGLVHRDVSPQNILLGTDGVARLTDFGIAKTAFGKGRSGVGMLKGKLGYMAPEYIDGHPANACSDVFGLAIVVWEMLAGRRLFRGENGHDTLRNVLYSEAPLLSSVEPSLGDDLSEVIATALSKDPSGRFATAKAFGAALETVARRSDLIASSEDVTAFVMRAVGEKVLARRKRIADLFSSEKASRNPVLALVRRPSGEIESPVQQGAVRIDAAQDTVSAVVMRPVSHGSQANDVTLTSPVSNEVEDAPSGDAQGPVTLPSAREALSPAGSDPMPHDIAVFAAPEPEPDPLPPISREEPTPRAVPQPRRRSDAPVAPPVAPSEPESPAAEPPRVSGPPTLPPPRMRLARDRTFQVVAVAAFVFGALVRVLWSMGAPDASAEPLAPSAIEAPAAAGH